MSKGTTPLMQQYWALKQEAGQALLLFRMGDFYELFGEDAVRAADVLEITLTSRDKNKENPVPMAGVPHHSIQPYIQKLLNAGYKVALGEQLEDPAASKGIVKRGIVREFSPAIQFSAESAEAHYIATVVPGSKKATWLLACLEPSTGETLVSPPQSISSLNRLLSKIQVRHFLRMDGLPDDPLELPQNPLEETLPGNFLSLKRAQESLLEHYQIQSLETLLPEGLFDTEAAAFALGVLVRVVLKAQKLKRLSHLRLPQSLQDKDKLRFGPQLENHLDLRDLFDLIDTTKTSLGSRRLRNWIHEPLARAEEIQIRQDGVRETREMKPLPNALQGIYDLERISGRINTRLANPRDTRLLAQSLSEIPQLVELLDGRKTLLLQQLLLTLRETWEQLEPMVERILKEQRDPPPLVSRDGKIFQTGTHLELDRLIELTEKGENWLIDLEKRERKATGIPSLKVRYNRVFGYYIEVTKAHLHHVPDHYQRKQSMVNAERFFTDELKNFEEEMLTASDRRKALEQDLFQGLLEDLEDLSPEIREASEAISVLDALGALSRCFESQTHCFPIIDESYDLELTRSRHAVVDSAMRGEFVPNSIDLRDGAVHALLITGPNMGGKSTIMRQVAQAVILGQMGAPVPAEQARWGIFKSIFTRIGAQDAISKGQSTFMVEMSELAHLLHHADRRSLIVLDEIGRGTSTYDGLSVAWATLEWIAQSRARSFFATHYHELTKVVERNDGFENAHMAVESREESGKTLIRFLYELQNGPSNESFGIQVAEMAGVPSSVLDRARQVLQDLETPKQQTEQLSLFTSGSQASAEESLPSKKNASPAEVEPHPILAQLQGLRVEEMTPLEALSTLDGFQKELSPETGS